MAERTDRQQFSPIGGERRVNVPAKTTNRRHVRGLLRAGHLVDGELRENGTAIEQRLGEFRQIVGGRKQTRMASDSSHPARTRIMNYAAQHLVVLVVLGGSNLRNP